MSQAVSEKAGYFETDSWGKPGQIGPLQDGVGGQVKGLGEGCLCDFQDELLKRRKTRIEM